MAAVSWTLQTRGRLRPRTFLFDAEGAEVTRVSREGRIRSTRAGSGVDAEGHTWRVVGDPDDLRISRDGRPRAMVTDGILEIDDRRYGWRVPEDGSRSARVQSATGGPGWLRIGPGEGDVWATVEFDDELPDAFGLVLAACVRVLQIDADRASGALRVPQEEDAEAGSDARDGTGSGGGSAEASADAVVAEADEDVEPPSPAADEVVPSGEGSTGPAPATHEGAMEPRWALFVEGRRSPRLLLSDGGQDAMAELHVRGGPPGSLGRALERDGRRWLAELDGGTVTVSCGGRTFATAEGEQITIGGRTLPWHASLDGAKTATVTDDDGTLLLQIAPGPESGGPWATVAFDDALPSPMATTLASLFVLLRVDALGRRQ